MEQLRFNFEVRFFFGLDLLQELVDALRGFADGVGGNLANFLAGLRIGDDVINLSGGILAKRYRRLCWHKWQRNLLCNNF